MNDPHVVALIYRVEHGNSVDYGEAQPLIREESAFRVEVKDNQARFELKDHYATEEDARNAIKDYNDDWECHACLEHGLDYFRLLFDEAEIVDRNPTSGVRHLGVTFAPLTVGPISATLTVVVPNYPAPPSEVNFKDSNVKRMYQRYMEYRQGTEKLPGMAQFCLTVLEDSTGMKKNRRPAAAQKYQIDLSVLKKIGALADGKGGSSARKAKGVKEDFTNEEHAFLEQAIQRIIRRAAEKAHNSKKEFPQISLSDLPPI